MKRWQHLLWDETAGGAAEYGILIAGIALAVMATVVSIGQTVYTKLYVPASKLIK